MLILSNELPGIFSFVKKQIHTYTLTISSVVTLAKSKFWTPKAISTYATPWMKTD